MARVPGFGSGFSANAFRTAIRNTMTMGLPEDPDKRATFRWNKERTYAVADPSGMPYSWDDTPATELVRPDVQIPVAFDFSARPAASSDTSLGQFDAPRVEITVLDTDYPQIEGADMVMFDGATYVIDFWAPPQGLFDVTIHTCYATALDEV